MVISEKNKYCFVAVPKPGTTAITKQLRKDPSALRGRVVVRDKEVFVNKHATAREIVNVIGQIRWENLYLFAFVRNPWDRVVSAYFYYRSGRAAETVLKGKHKKPKPSKTNVSSICKLLLAKLLRFSL